MKIIDAIALCDDLKENSYDYEHKLAWLSKLDLMIQRSIIDVHEGGGDAECCGYDADTDERTELLAPAPFDAMYLHWLKAQIDLENGDYAKYNADIALFNAEYAAFESDYHRNHAPISSAAQRFLF